jgi:hypothetical protein
MERNKAIEAYRRTKEWSQQANARLQAELESRAGTGINPHLLHNWSIGNTPEAYRLSVIKRWHDHAQQAIWDTSTRLSDAFARYF